MSSVESAPPSRFVLIQSTMLPGRSLPRGPGGEDRFMSATEVGVSFWFCKLAPTRADRDAGPAGCRAAVFFGAGPGGRGALCSTSSGGSLLPSATDR
jgi:hypothetical protein